MLTRAPAFTSRLSRLNIPVSAFTSQRSDFSSYPWPYPPFNLQHTQLPLWLTELMSGSGYLLPYCEGKLAWTSPGQGMAHLQRLDRLDIQLQALLVIAINVQGVDHFDLHWANVD